MNPHDDQALQDAIVTAVEMHRHERRTRMAELRNRISIADLNGNVKSRWGRFPTDEPGMFKAPHGIWVDSHGDVYVGEFEREPRVGAKQHHQVLVGGGGHAHPMP